MNDMGVEGGTKPANERQPTRDELVARCSALQRTVDTLAERVEMNVNAVGSAFSLFESTVALENIVAQRTQQLERTNKELIVARDAAEEHATAKADFLARMSHEIRTPMNGVLGAAQLLDLSSLDDDQRTLVSTITACGEALLRLINDILDFSRLERKHLPLKPERTDVTELVDEVCLGLLPIADEKGLFLYADTHWEHSYHAYVDPDRIRQVLVNLIGNALKYTDRGSAKVTAIPEERTGKMGMRFDVVDTGIGMAPDFIAKALEPFTQEEAALTRKHGGSGLGLAIVKQLGEAMGGELLVESELNVGTSVTFWVPTMVESVPRPAPANASDLRKLTIGVAVKEGMVRNAIVNHLRTVADHVESVDFSTIGLRPLSDVVAPFGILIVDAPIHERICRQIGDRIVVMPYASPRDRLTFNIGGDSIVFARPLRYEEALKALTAAMAAIPQLQENSPVDEGLLGSSGVSMRAPEPPIEPTPRHVLVVEDNEANIRVITLMLKNMGYTCDVAKNGAEAVAVFGLGVYAFILMDVQMPVMDGLEATRQIRSLEQVEGLAPSHIVALTANALPQDRDACLAAGMDDYLAKPVTLKTLSDVCAKFGEKIAA